MSITPTPEQLRQLTDAPDDGPVVMLNLLAFNDDGGSSSYGKYGEAAIRMVAESGGRLIWTGRVEQTVIGSSQWHAVALVEYPSRAAFLAMIARPDYLEAHEHRAAGLAGTELIACREA